MCHDVLDHLIHVSALRVEIGVGVVFRDAPHAVALESVIGSQTEGPALSAADAFLQKNGE